MSGAPLEYPPLRAYMSAVADLNNINIPFFKSNSMRIYLNRRGLPYMSVGGFGAVFRFKDKKENQFALKCFTRDVPGRAERYRALHDTLQITKFPFMVDFQYVEEGLRVGNSAYPVVVMEWGRGASLDHAIEADLEDDGVLQSAPRFAGNLFSVVKTLQQWNMGHNDLQEGNLLIGENDRITLIDYDGMFVPALEGKESNEIGLADYQHPARAAEHFGPSIDDFAMLSIMFQASIITPELWKKHHDDKRLLLKSDDYREPKKSDLIKKALKSKEKHVQALAELLVEAAGKDPLKIGAIEAVEGRAEIMNWLESTEETSVNTNFSSIISRVVALTDAQVEDFNQDRIELGPVNTPAPASAPSPNRQSQGEREEGSWELGGRIKQSLIDLFFEAEEDQGAAPGGGSGSSAGSGGGTLKRIKEGVLGLFFVREEGEGDEEPATHPAPSAPSAGGTRAAPSASGAAGASNPPSVPSPPPPPSGPPPGSGGSATEGKTEAPIPDWMKRRRRK